MILLFAVIIILFEAIGEGLIKRHSLANFIFIWWLQWLILIALFAVWFFLIIGFEDDIPIWKLITGFVFVRFMIFDVAWNEARGVRWNYYGTNKLYDRVMTKLASFGWFMKLVCGVIGIVFLLGIK